MAHVHPHRAIVTVTFGEDCLGKIHMPTYTARTVCEDLAELHAGSGESESTGPSVEEYLAKVKECNKMIDTYSWRTPRGVGCIFIFVPIKDI